MIGKLKKILAVSMCTCVLMAVNVSAAPLNLISDVFDNIMDVDAVFGPQPIDAVGSLEKPYIALNNDRIWLPEVTKSAVNVVWNFTYEKINVSGTDEDLTSLHDDKLNAKIKKIQAGSSPGGLVLYQPALRLITGEWDYGVTATDYENYSVIVKLSASSNGNTECIFVRLPFVLYGDINEDGVFNGRDYNLLAFVFYYMTLTSPLQNTLLSDVDQDGAFDANDYFAMQNVFRATVSDVPANLK